MICGVVEAGGAPVIYLSLAGQSWRAIIDTGFNGDLELPYALRIKRQRPVLWAGPCRSRQRPERIPAA